MFGSSFLRLPARPRPGWRSACLWAVVAALSGCTCSPRVLFPVEDAAVTADAGCTPLGAHCGGMPCACENCLDDDADGVVDVGHDPECTGYSDDDEATFATGLSGDNKDCRQDCFFDGNSGGGGADCQVPLACMVEIASYNARAATSCPVVPPNPSATNDCTITGACAADCMGYVPPGCDCFGCCDVIGSDTLTYHVLVGSPCTHADLGSGLYGNCIECFPSTSCRSACTTPCGTAGAACAAGSLCVFGCCVTDTGG